MTDDRYRDMSVRLRRLFEKIETWPAEDQAKFIEYANGIETRRKAHGERVPERAVMRSSDGQSRDGVDEE